MQLQGQFDTGVDVGRDDTAPRRAEPGRSGVRSLAARVLTVALLAALAALAALHAPPLQAQTTLTTFVSNTSVNPLSAFNTIYGQSFETGATTGGYTVSEVDVHLSNVSGKSAAVEIKEDNGSDEPGDLVATLANPDTLTADSLNTFTAPAGTTLAASTTYWIVVNENIADAADRATVSVDGSNDETGEPGWSIGDGVYYKDAASDDWSTSNSSLRIAVKGTSGGTTTLSNDATLSGLTLEDGDGNAITLDTVFASDDYEYEVSVANDIDAVKLTATKNDSSAMVVITDDDDVNTPDEAELDLSVGSNTLTVTVTAEDTSTLTYTVTVTRREPYVCAAPDLSGRSEVWSGTVTVGTDGSTYGYQSGTDAYGALSDTDFDYGGNDYIIEGITQLGNTALAWVKIDLDSSFPDSDRSKLSLHICDGTFTLTSAIENTVDNDYTVLRIGDAPASFYWSGATTVQLALSEPPTLSTDATLSGLGLEDSDGNDIPLDTDFASDDYEYEVSVANGIDAVKLTATKNDDSATVVITDDDDVNTPDEAELDLSVGSNTLTVTVTAEDTSTELTYTVNVERAAAIPTLVSNTYQTEIGSSNNFFAQPFETGANPDGYTVSEVDVYLVSGSGRSTSVKIREDDGSDEPGDLVATLTNPDTLTANSLNTFTASPGIRLDASTTYWITVNEGITSNRATVARVSGWDETGEPGWSIGDSHLFRADESSSWSESINVLKIAIRGTAFCDGIWCATLTVKGIGSSNRGCAVGHATNKCSDPDILSEDEFTYDGTDYTVTALRDETDGTLELWLTQAIDDGLVFHVDDETFNFADADVKENTAGEMKTRQWNDANLSWTPSDTVHLKMTESGGTTNTEAEGQPEISGAPQEDMVLEAEQGSIDDTDGLPTGTFPSGYTFEWISVDASDVETPVGTNSSYTVSSTDVGSKIRVEVSFTDGAGNSETVISDPVGPVVAAARDSCPVGNDWEATLTMGYSSSKTAGVRNQQFGFNPGVNPIFGNLAPTLIPHGSTPFTVTRIFRSLTTMGNTVLAHTLSFRVTGGDLPDGTVLDLGGTELTVGTASHQPTEGQEQWNLFTLGLNPTWVGGQEMTVCANLPPGLVSAIVDGTSLVLTYDQDLDTSSTPAASAYTVKVDGGTGASPSSVSVAGTTVTLTLAAAVTSANTVTLSYTAPASNAVQDGSGIPALSFTDEAVSSDPSRLVLSRTSLSVGEAGSGTFTVKLATQPGANVTVTVSSDDTDAATVFPATLTFTMTNWNSTQTVTVSGVNDTNTDNESVTVTASAAGGGYGGKTAAVSVSVTDNNTAQTVPGAPRNLNATADGQTQIDLGWNAPTSNGGSVITGYKIEVSTNSGSSWSALVSNTGNTSRSYSHTGLSAGTTRHYRVSAINAIGTGSTSNVDSATTDRTVVTFGSNSYTATEGGSGATVVVRLSQAPATSVTIPLTKTHRGGATGGDHLGIPDDVVFTSAQTQRSFTVTAVDDSDDDDGESVRIGFGTLPSGYAQGSPAATTVALLDDEGSRQVVVGFTTHTAYVVERRESESSFRVPVRLNRKPLRSVTIPLVVTHMGGATAADYEGIPASVTFGANDTKADFFMRVIPDEEREIGEGLRIDFGDLPSNVSKDSWGRYETIEFVDDLLDSTVWFGTDAYTATEGGGAARVSIHLDAPVKLESLDVGLVLRYGGGATAADHGSIPAVVRFAIGQQTKTITVAATNDSDDDDGESVTLSFVNVSDDRVNIAFQPVRPSRTTVSLADNDGPLPVTVSFGAATYTAREGGSGASVSVELDAAPGRSVTVPLTTTHRGGATGGDYSGVPASVTFGANETRQTFTVTATNDSADDGGESLSIGFGTLPANVSAGSPAVVALDDDDGGSVQRVTVGFGMHSLYTSEVRESTWPSGITLSLNRVAQRPVTIPLLVTHLGGATEADYTGIPASVTFEADQRRVSFRIYGVLDEEIETGEGLRIEFGTLPPGVRVDSLRSYRTVEFVDTSTDP